MKLVNPKLLNTFILNIVESIRLLNPKNMIQKILIVILSGAFSMMSYAQSAPKVFQIGTQEKAYEALNSDYSQSFLEACGNDMVVAFEKWIKMTEAMDEYANKISFDIKGVKVWFHIFSDAEGKIQHIGYLLRSESKNVNDEDFRAFLSSFMNRYQFPIQSAQPFSHYSIASFPVYSQTVNK